ncbi:hypothetical protein [Phreatobacter cathodiphilus]|uniref:Uncharacterized protein n=1 Tax=Phreatobacter cathodiphilus TaxID=1868589 RepID=A0A2S0N9V5_9HYPH|nr:hypothetical protein [Phreatobacter cathodiphilus]AVO44928.1 hypothetical protein C6569_07545 [Phreatobacter cathodiphilus]
MFGIMALLAFTLPWVLLPAMAGLIWLLRTRRLRAVPALAALILAALPHLRECLHAIGLGLPYPGEETTALGRSFRAQLSAAEGFAWPLLVLAAVAAAVLSWPPPDRTGTRVLAVLVVAGLAASAALIWSFTGLRFN